MPGAYGWVWDDAYNEWIRVPASVKTVLGDAIGNVVPGAHKLYWIVCSPDSTGSEFELSDDLTGLTTEVYCHFDDDRHSEHLLISPPMQFHTGISIKKFDKIKCLHFGYI